MISRKLAVGGLHYPVLECGSGPLVICLHGFPDNNESFAAQLPLLAGNGYRAVAPLLPGYAESSQNGAAGHNVINARDCLIALIDLLLAEQDGDQPRRVQFIGHDWGAVIGYLIAERRPDLLRALMCLSVPYNLSGLWRIASRAPGYFISSRYISLFHLPFIAPWWLQRHDFAMVDRLLANWSPHLTVGETRRTSIKKTLAQDGVVGAALGYYRHTALAPSAAAREFRRRYQSRINVPTVAIRGSGDGCIPESAWELISPASFTAGIRLERMDCGHWPHWERKDEFNARMLDWLNHSGAA